MALLKSRPLTKHATGFESLQLSESLTFAEESLRKVLVVANGAATIEWKKKEIILSVKKNRPTPLPSDSSGYILQGELANAIGKRYWHSLTKKQQDRINVKGSLAYQAENRDDFTSRTVFFRGVVTLEISGLDVIHRHVIAVVEVFACSRIWQAADVRFWENEAHQYTETPHKYQGGKASVMSTVAFQFPTADSRPPVFLL